MNSMPIFWSQPGLQLPRPDRLNIKALFSRETLSRDEDGWISALVSTYGLSLLHPARKVETNGRSHNWHLITNGGQKILKMYKSSVEAEHILHEHSILSQLALIQFPAPRINRNLHGETLIESKDRQLALFDYLDDYFHYHERIYFPSQTKAFLTLAAMSLAALHEALPGFTPTGKNPNGFISEEGSRYRGLSWYAGQLAVNAQQSRERSMERSGHELTAIHSRRQWIEDRLTALDEMLMAAPLERVIIHGDYGPYNLLFKNGSPVVIIDFELARLDWRLTDLAASMSTFARNRLGFQQTKMRHFIQVYQRASRVSAEQLDYLPAVWEYLSLRRLIVCWSRALETGQKKWLVEALDRLRMIDWIASHTQSMLKMVAR